MRINLIINLLKRNSMCLNYFLIKPHFPARNFIHHRFLQTTSIRKSGLNDGDSSSENELDTEFSAFYNQPEIEQGYAKDLLYKDSREPLLLRIYNCVSIQELFNVFDRNKQNYKSRHIVQTILVLWDLKRISEEISLSRRKSLEVTEFFRNLEQNPSFQLLLRKINLQRHKFNNEELSFILLYLNKLGLVLDAPLLQKLISQLQKSLIKNFEISSASRFVEAVFSEYSLKPYFLSQDLIPLIIKQLNARNSLDNWGYLSTCLNTLRNVITDDTMAIYRDKVTELLSQEIRHPQDLKLILKIIALLNYPRWRHPNTELIVQLILAIKEQINSLRIGELIIIYEVFYKIQEPGVILNDLQRCSAKFLQNCEGTSLERAILFSCLVYFSSPQQRSQFQDILKTYVNESDNFDNLIQLRKILSSVKVSDLQLCKEFWNKIVVLLSNNQIEDINVIKLGQNYMTFNIDINNYRHEEFERTILNIYKKLAKDSIFQFMPQKLSSILAFALNYCNDDKEFLNYLINKLEQNWQQLSHLDCLKLSLAIRLSRESEQKYLKSQLISRLSQLVNRVIVKELPSEKSVQKNHLLLKSCSYKNDVNEDLINLMLLNYRHLNLITSKDLENVTFHLLSNDVLIPEVVDKLTEYVVGSNQNIIGFNLEKVLFLCYHFGYFPKNSDKFFDIAANIIIRDQERMSGLTVLHCALSLCFFHKLPKSLIKSIFNVEFLDKLDLELANCYSKERYPQRVRNNMMRLNRAVCLDYPEANVPWFHQKYVEELNRNFNEKKIFPRRVKETLLNIVGNPKALLENVQTPYGYLVDFVINLDSQGNVSEYESATKLAIVLLPQFAFTKMYTQLRGQYQMKHRHLEILGYRVVTVNFSDWISLYYPEEKTSFLTNLIWPKKC